MPQDPREKGPKPPHPSQQQEPPGLESEMDPKPDYGEESYKGSGKLKGKAAVITGGDSGIGRAVALAFAREGADVLISYLSEESDARETARVVEAAGQKCVAVPGDIVDEAHCRAIIDRAVLAAYCQAYGRWVEAEEHLRETPALIRTPSGHVQQSPWLSIANRQMEIMGRYMAEIGLTPASRSRIVALNKVAVPGPSIRLVFVDPEGVERDAEGRLVEGERENEVTLDQTALRL